MNPLIYVVFGVVLVVLVLALHDRLRASTPALIQTATGFGPIRAGFVIASGTIANVGTAVVIDLYGADPAGAAATWGAIGPVVEGWAGATRWSAVSEPCS
jgi:hypothetical protein